MTTYRVGTVDLELEVVGAGLRNGVLPSNPTEWELARSTVELGPREQSDVNAFLTAGWRFAPDAELNWASVKAQNPGRIRPGLLARHPSGGLVILRNRLVLKLTQGTKAENLARLAERYEMVKKLEIGEDLYAVRLRPPDQDLQDAIRDELALLMSSRSPVGPVAHAEPSLLYHFTRPGRLVSEGSRDAAPFGRAVLAPGGGAGGLDSHQWHWEKIKLAEAWQMATTEGDGIRVGVIDLGFHTNEPEIQPNIDWKVYVNGDGDVFENTPLNPDQHGTFCASLIGALQNGRSVNGAAPRCKLALVALPSSGVFSQEALGAAIKICAAGKGTMQGVDVISCSLGLSEKASDLQEFLREAFDEAMAEGRGGKGTPIVWAIFNSNREIRAGSLEDYRPLICVAQTNSSDAKVSSGFGAGLDLLAPGARVPGIVWGSSSSAITKLSGSSLAAPCTAGVAALVLSVHGGLHAREVAAILAKSCDPLGTATGWNKRTGWGRLNARNAVELALQVKNGTVDLQALMAEIDQAVPLPSPPPPEPPGLHA
jgi:hypothetical protein